MDYIPPAIQLLLSVITLVSTVYAVRYELRSKLDNLNKQIIEAQDRRIKLLEQELATERAQRQKMEGELLELRATVEAQARTITRLESARGRRQGPGARGQGPGARNPR